MLRAMAVRRTAVRVLPVLGAAVAVVACGVAPERDAAPRPAPATPTTAAASPSPSPTQTLQVFFTPTDAAGDCAAVEGVDREVPRTEAVATAALQQLFAGPTEAEQRRGLRSFFGPETRGLLRSVRVADGVAYVDLDAQVLQLNGASTSCGSAALTATIGRTLRQFPTVDDVRHAVEGDPSAFSAFVQAGCPEPRRPGDRCDPEPFRR